MANSINTQTPPPRTSALISSDCVNRISSPVETDQDLINDFNTTARLAVNVFDPVPLLETTPLYFANPLLSPKPVPLRFDRYRGWYLPTAAERSQIFLPLTELSDQPLFATDVPFPEFHSEMDSLIPPSELEPPEKQRPKRQKGKKRTAVLEYGNLFSPPKHHRHRRDHHEPFYTGPVPVGTTIDTSPLYDQNGEIITGVTSDDPLLVSKICSHQFNGYLEHDIPVFFALFRGKGYVPSQLPLLPLPLVIDSILAWTQGYGLKDFVTLQGLLRLSPNGPYVVPRRRAAHTHSIPVIRRFLKVMNIHGNYEHLAPYFKALGYNHTTEFISEMFNPLNFLKKRVADPFDDYISEKTDQISAKAAENIKESIKEPGFLEEVGSRIGLSAGSSVGTVFKNMLTTTLSSLTDMGTSIALFVKTHLSIIVFTIIGILIGLVGFTLVRLAFTAIFPSKTPDFISEGDTTACQLIDWLGNTVSNGLVPTFSKTASFKTLAAGVTLFTFFEKAPKFVDFATSVVKAIIDHTWQFIYNCPYFKTTADVQAFLKTLEDMMSFVDRDYEKIPHSEKELFCERYEQLQMYQARATTFKDKELFMRLSAVLNNRRDLYNTVRANIKVAVTRQEPTSAWLTGDPGLGKTEFVDRIFEYLYHLIVRHGKTSSDPVRSQAFTDLADEKWNRSHIGLHSHQDAFFSNYAKNWAFLLDDWRQFGDDQAINSETQIFMLGKATGRFPLPMAELKDKGSNFFVSKVIGVTTNMSETSLTVPVGYSNFDAFNRRRDLIIHLGGQTNDAAYGSIDQYKFCTYTVKQWNHRTKVHETLTVPPGVSGFRMIGKLLYERYLYYTDKFMKNSTDFDFGETPPPSPPHSDNDDPPPPSMDQLVEDYALENGVPLTDTPISPERFLNSKDPKTLSEPFIRKVFDNYYMLALKRMHRETEYVVAAHKLQLTLVSRLHDAHKEACEQYLLSWRPKVNPLSMLFPREPLARVVLPDGTTTASNLPTTTTTTVGNLDLIREPAPIDHTKITQTILDRESLADLPADIINGISASMGYPPLIAPPSETNFHDYDSSDPNVKGSPANIGISNVGFKSEMDALINPDDDNYLDDGYDTASEDDDFALQHEPHVVQQSRFQNVKEQAWYAVMLSPITGPALTRRLHRTVAKFQSGKTLSIPRDTGQTTGHALNRGLGVMTADINNFLLLFCSYLNAGEVWQAITSAIPAPRFKIPWLEAFKAHIKREFRPDQIPSVLMPYPEIQRYAQTGEIRHVLDSLHDYHAVYAAGGLHIPTVAYAWKHLTPAEKQEFDDWSKQQYHQVQCRAVRSKSLAVLYINDNTGFTTFQPERGGMHDATMATSIALHMIIAFAVSFIIARAILYMVRGLVYLLEYFGLITRSEEYFESEHSIDLKALQERQRLFKLLKQGNSSAKSQGDQPESFVSEQGDAISSIEARVASNIYVSEIEFIDSQSTKRLTWANAFFLSQSLMVLPKHVFLHGQLTHITFYPGIDRRRVNTDHAYFRDIKTLSQLDPTDLKLVELEQAFDRRDLAVLWVPGIRFRKDMVTHLLRRPDLVKLLLTRGTERIELGELKGDVTIKTTVTNEPIRILGLEHTQSPITTDKVTVTDYYRVPSLPGGDGLCGMPYISLSNHIGTNYVLGLHIASNVLKIGGVDSIVAPFFREEIEYILTKIPKDEFNSECAFGEPEFIQLPSFPLTFTDTLASPLPGTRAMYKLNKRIFFNTQTKLRPTVFQTGNSEFPPPYETTKAPAALTYNARRLSVRKLEGRQLDCSMRVLDDPHYWHGIFRGLPEDCATIIDLASCILGVPSLGIPPTDLTTAAGSPFTQYNVTRDDLIKRDHPTSNVVMNTPVWYFDTDDSRLTKPTVNDFSELQVPGLWVHPNLQYAFYMRHYCSRKGIHCPVLYNMFLKDEDRPIERVEAEFTRYVNAAPIDSMLFNKSIFARFLVALDDNRASSDSKVGLNTYSHEWSQFYTFLSRISDRVVSQDVSGWDIRFPVNMFVPAFLKYFRLYFKLPIFCVFYRLLKTSVITHFVVYLVVDDYLVVLIIMPSGGFCTCLFNTAQNSAEHRFVQHKLVDLGDPETHTFDETNAIGVQGDDSLLASKFTPEYNGQTIAIVRNAIFNHECTEQDKTPELHESIPIHDAVFLQRSFRLEQGHVFCPLNPESLKSCVQWVYKPSDKTFDEQVKINMHFAITEWAQHGKHAFTAHKHTLNKYVSPKSQYYLEFDHVLKKILSDSYERPLGPMFAERFKTATSFFE